MTSSFTFVPSTVTVTQGTTITWTNTATFNHTTTSDTPGIWDSNNVAGGSSFSFTFNTVGTFGYFCKIHGSSNGTGMAGTINVVAPTATPTFTPTSTPSSTGTPTASATPTETPTAGSHVIFIPSILEGGAGTPSPSPTTTAAPTPESASVSLVNYAFQPTPLTIKVGTTVIWTNTTTSTAHTVTADNNSFNSGNLDPGKTFSFTFNTPGTFAYYCQYHGGPGGVGMAGTIVVNPSP
jgi:plastocyanin